MFISSNKTDICHRRYGDFIVLYDVCRRTIIRLDDVAADIWEYISLKDKVTINDITEYIASLYECDQGDILPDIESFIDELYYFSAVSKNDKSYCGNCDQGIDNDDNYEEVILKEMEELNQIYSATLELTYDCNEQCVHCYATFPNSGEHRQIALAKYQEIINELKDMGCLHLTFTGGDPFVNKDFPEIFKYAREKGFVCDIFTNGLALYDNPELMIEIVNQKPRAFYISLYGASADVHDEITRVKGSFQKTITVARDLISRGVPVVFNVMILVGNYDDLDSIIDLCTNIGAEYRISMSVINRNDGSDDPMKYFLSDKEKIKCVLAKVSENYYSMDKPLERADRGTFMCGAGITSLTISPEGQVFPCVSLKDSLGDVFSMSLKDCWDGQKRKDVREALRWEKSNICNECNLFDYCTHCPGISQSESGIISDCNTCDKILAQCSFEIENL